MVRYPTRAVKAVGYLKRAYNDVEIYVEDSSLKGVYDALIGAMLPLGTRFAGVTPIGDRGAVLAACRTDQVDDGRRRLYLIDGDFDILAGIAKPRLRYLYRLRAYCVENLLISDSAITEVACQAAPGRSRTEVIGDTAVGVWRNSVVKTLVPLFVTYAAAKVLAPEIPTIGFSVHRLSEPVPNDAQLSRSLVWNRVRDVRRATIAVVGKDSYRKFYRDAITRLRSAKVPIDHLITGKDYLLPLVWRHLLRKVGYRERIDQLKGRLAAMYEPSVEPYLRRRLLSL